MSDPHLLETQENNAVVILNNYLKYKNISNVEFVHRTQVEEVADNDYFIDAFLKNKKTGKIINGIEIKTLESKNNKPCYYKKNGNKSGLNKFPAENLRECNEVFPGFKGVCYAVVNPFSGKLFLATDKDKINWLPDFSRRSKQKKDWLTAQDYEFNPAAVEAGEKVKMLSEDFFDEIITFDVQTFDIIAIIYKYQQ